MIEVEEGGATLLLAEEFLARYRAFVGFFFPLWLENLREMVQTCACDWNGVRCGRASHT